jgi:hypothetical protein
VIGNVDRTGDIEFDIFSFQQLRGLEEIGNAFAEVDLPEEENAERPSDSAFSGDGESASTLSDSVGEGNDVDFFSRNALLDESFLCPFGIDHDGIRKSPLGLAPREVFLGNQQRRLAQPGQSFSSSRTISTSVREGSIWQTTQVAP